MSRRYTGRNPLDGAVPQPEWQRGPVQGHTEPPEFDWNPHSKSNIMARRAAAEIRRKYRIETGDVKAMAQHDNEMRTTWNQLMDGTYQPPPTVQVPSAEYEAMQAAHDPRNWR